MQIAMHRGRHADALRVYRDYRQLLIDELGVDPSPALAELEQRVLNHDPALVPPEPAGRPLRGYRLGERLGTGRDGTVYAVAGAKAHLNGEQDLARQVDWLLVDHALLPSDAVYVVMIGGNDVIDALQANAADRGTGTPPSAAIIESAVDAIGTQVERLLDFGARRLVVANVPDLAALPAVRADAHASTDEARFLATAAAISESFNVTLAARLDRVEARTSSLTPKPVIALRSNGPANQTWARPAPGPTPRRCRAR